MATMEEDVIPDFCSKPALILGCGNVFFGDDGFGCALAEYLETHFDVPGSVCLLDAGTGVRKLLFTLCLSPVRPRRLLIVDAVDFGREPGEWFEIDPAEIPAVKLDDFSMHQLPTSNLLRELQQQTGVEVRVLACQTGPLPEQVCPGLSEAVRRAVPHAAEWVEREYFGATLACSPHDCSVNIQLDDLRASASGLSAVAERRGGAGGARAPAGPAAGDLARR